MLFVALIVATALSFAIAFLLMPQPKIKPIPARPAKPIAPRIEPPPALPFDPSAFWLYPDWDGPVDEPFWMRPIKVPPKWPNRENYSGAAFAPARIREFHTTATGEAITWFGTDICSNDAPMRQL